MEKAGLKKALIITYYWPPSGGAGVQRWLKFAKYFRHFGWEPIIYTPENPEVPEIDNSLQEDVPDGLKVIRRPITEPYDLYKRITGRKKGERIQTAFLTEEKKPGLAEKLSVWIRGNFFIPDARKFWIKPSIRFLRKYLKENPVDAIISTGPPHSMHMIAMGLKKQLHIPWLADFRDPWTNIDFYDDLMLTKWANRKHHRMEKQVLQSAEHVCVISNGMAENFINIHNRHYEVITNGYDPEDLPTENTALDEKFSLAHIGSLSKTRNPEALWTALNELVKEHDDFAKNLEIKLVGKVDLAVRQSIEYKGLWDFVKKINYLPHDEVVKEQRKSQVLLLLINNTPNAKGILTGKFFEYMAAQRPILCIGPEEGDAARIIRKTGCGSVFGFEEVAEIKSYLLRQAKQVSPARLEVNHAHIEAFSRKTLTKEITQILNTTTQ